MFTRSLDLRLKSILLCLLAPWLASAQIKFTNGNARITGPACYSGGAITVVDMNGDGLDDLCLLDRAYLMHVQEQRIAQNFVEVPGISMSDDSAEAWAMMVGDVNEDGYKDVFYGGFHITMSKYNMGTSSYTSKSELPNSNFFQQNMNAMDVDNDGDIDFFSCNDNGPNAIWLNDGAGIFTESNIIDWNITSGDESGNYGSVWSDFDNDGDVDLYISHCRQGVNDANDPRRINVLFENNGDGTYFSNAAAHNIAIGAQTWTGNFDDINNDGWFDLLLTNLDVQTMMMINDGMGGFTNINASNAAGLNIDFIPIQSKLMDFDNDGYLDILITGGLGLTESARLFRNNGNNTFTGITNAFPNNNSIHSFAVGDLNHDGLMDIYAGYGTGLIDPSTTEDILWLNNTKNANHFVTFNLKGTASNTDALGARIFIYGDWGVQTREVRAGESYGTCNTLNLHFGLGDAQIIDSVIINWPSGTVTKLYDKPVDQFITVIENQCISPNNNISGSLIQCSPGESKTLSAPAGSGYSYLWNTGATTQTIQTTSEGEYNVKVTAGGCSSHSPVVRVQYNPDETPEIQINGDLYVCQNVGPELHGPLGYSSYLWSNGLTTQSIQVEASGSYALTVQGACQSWTSDSINVAFFDSTVSPITTGYDLPIPGFAFLTATGNNVEWYGAPSGGPMLGTGNEFAPFVSTTTNFYAQAVLESEGETHYTGMQNHSGNPFSASNSTNAATKFTVFETCILKSVKVYTDESGKRLIEVRDIANDSVVASAEVLVANTEGGNAGETINLNFRLDPGDYKILTNANLNMSELGYAGPRLKRNETGATYPYDVPSVLRITGNDQGDPQRFYYFYDWVVKSDVSRCETERVPALVTVGNMAINETAITGLVSLYPNPAITQISLLWKSDALSNASIKIMDLTGKVLTIERNVNLEANTAKTIDVSYLSAGIYVIEVSDGQKNDRIKFIIQ